MNISQMYIFVAIVVLAVIALLVFVAGKRGPGRQLTPLASFAFAFVLAGIVFGENRLVGYGLMGIGILLAVIDIFRNRNRPI
jgi:hypothetical protein